MGTKILPRCRSTCATPSRSPGASRCSTRSPTHDEAWPILADLCERNDNTYTRDPSKKIQLLNYLGEHDDPRAAKALVPYLEDMDEGVRFVAVEALLHHKDAEAAREPLLELLTNEKEESRRIKKRILDGFADLGWDVKGFSRHRREAARRTCCPARASTTTARSSASRSDDAAPRPTSRRSCSSARGRSSSGRPASSTTRAPRACARCAPKGFEVVLVNSNPATIMTDPELAERTYVEPLTVEVCEKIIAERAARRALADAGRADRAQHRARARRRRRPRQVRRQAHRRLASRPSRRPRIASSSRRRWRKIGLEVPRSGYARSLDEARAMQKSSPARLSRSSCARRSRSAAWAAASPTTPTSSTRRSPGRWRSRRAAQILVEESVLGWKEYELEVMRDRADNVVIICSIENFDPMGVHTGDSITVAPAMTLTDKEYQRMRDAACRGHPRDRRRDRRLERAVRGQPGRRAHGHRRDEPARVALARRWRRRRPASPSPRSRPSWPSATRSTRSSNDITRETPASFEPTIDYVVVKVPRFAFEKFPGADATLTTQMKSVGEVDGDRPHLPRGARQGDPLARDRAHRLRPRRCRRDVDELKRRIATPTAERLFQLARGAAARRSPSTRSHRAHQDRSVVPDAASQRIIAQRGGSSRGRALADYRRRRAARASSATGSPIGASPL